MTDIKKKGIIKMISKNCEKLSMSQLKELYLFTCACATLDETKRIEEKE